MTLSAGSKLGVYEILSPLGAGGMGEVWKARDTRLNREVAVKVLPEKLASDAAALERFEREAKAVAALSHPNVLGIFDLGKDGGTTYAAMELLIGETLRHRLQEGPLPQRKALDYALQIAHGLAAAHEKGIVHRDLKPENIFVTRDGRAKILDFGLAKVTQAEHAAPLTDLPTAPAGTEPGVVLGTLGYMSPEQVKGLPADPRSDIFAFGTILYEMLSGKRAFHRGSAAETMSAILKEEPAGSLRDKSEHPAGHGAHRPSLPREESGRAVPFGARCGLRARGALGCLDAGSRLGGSAGKGQAARTRARVGYGSGRRAGHGRSCGALAARGSKNHRLCGRVAVRQRGRRSQCGVLERWDHREPDQQRGDSFSIRAELVDAREDTHLWGEEYNKRLSDILAMQEEIARDISGKLRQRLTGEEKKRLTKRYTENAEAYALYLKGRYHWNKRTGEDIQKGIGYFQQAIEKDPTYALAYAGPADSYAILFDYAGLPSRETFPKAKAAALKALEMDDTLAQAHAALAFVHQNFDWDFSAAEKEFRRAIELDPKYPTAHHWYSLYLWAGPARAGDRGGGARQ